MAKAKTKRSKAKKITKSVILPHKCPSCGLTAKTLEQDTKIFGQRNMISPDGQIVQRSQSYCRKCRTKHGQKMDTLKAKNKRLVKIDLRTNQGHKALGHGKQKKQVRRISKKQ